MTRTKHQKATIHDVANLANVSIATVSRALNKPDNVNKEMYDRVMSAAAQLGYTTNSAGKALKMARTRSIGTLLPRLNDAIFGEIAQGIQEVLYNNDYVGFLQTSGYDNSNIFEAVHRLLNQGAEGLLIFGRIEDQRLLDFLKKNPFPVLQIYSHIDEHPLPSVGIDNYDCMRKIVELMIQLGHTDIGLICGPTKGNDRQQTRLRAYLETMEQAGLKPNPQLVQPGFTINDGGLAFRRARKDNPDMTAVLCTTNELACGVLAECRKLGIDVPNEMSVTGFEDVNFAPLLYQPLTTLSVPNGEMGRYAARAMIARLDNGQELSSMLFETSVIVRESVKAARKGTDRAA